MKQIVVRAFGARLMGGTAAEAVATTVFRKQNNFWNNLVEIERGNREAYRSALVSSDIELAGLTERLAAEEATIEALLAARNGARAKARSKVNADGAQSYAKALKEAGARKKEIFTLMKACRERAKAAAKPLIEAAELKRREQVKAASSEHSMWWCHSEAVLAKYDTARSKSMKTGSELRFHRFEGSGSMGVRFTGDCPTMDRVLMNKSDLLQLREPTQSELGRMSAVKGDGGRRMVMRLRAGKKNDEGVIPTLELLVTLHAGRDLPTDVPLKTVTLRCDMHAGRPEWKIVLMFSREIESLPPVDLPRGAVGVDFGWRLVQENGEAGLRIAAISHGNRPVEYVTLGHDWMRRMLRAERLQGQLGDITNSFASEMLPMLSELALHQIEETEWFPVLCGKARRAKNHYPGLWLSICKAHTQAGIPLGEEIESRFRAWSKEAKKLLLEAHHTRRKAVDHRKHIYRNVAARLVRENGLLALEDADFAKLARLQTPDGEETELAITARRNRVWASPSEFRLAIEQAAKREQREVVKVPAARTTSTCFVCGHCHDGPMLDLIMVCQGCGKVSDQDENAANNIRKFALESQLLTLESGT